MGKGETKEEELHSRQFWKSKMKIVIGNVNTKDCHENCQIALTVVSFMLTFQKA